VAPSPRSATSATPASSRKGLFALDPATNLVDESFVADFDVDPDPTKDRAVEALAPAPGDNALFVGAASEP